MGSEEEADGGVGGVVGMKKEGIDATEDCSRLAGLLSEGRNIGLQR